jgi:hypothetical protein
MWWYPWSTCRHFLQTRISLLNEGAHEIMIGTLVYILKTIWGIVKWFPKLDWGVSTHRQQHVINWVITELPDNILVRSKDSKTLILAVSPWILLFLRLWYFPDSYNSFLPSCIYQCFFWYSASVRCYSKKWRTVTSICIQRLNIILIIFETLNIPELNHAIFWNRN